MVIQEWLEPDVLFGGGAAYVGPRGRGPIDMAKSGKLEFRGDALWCDGGPTGSWRLPSSDVSVVGEYTNANGPWIDDYFLVFVRPDRMCFEVSFHARGRDQALSDLGIALGGAVLRPGLCNSTEWRTRVLWPLQLADSPLWVLQREPPSGVWRRVLDVAGLPCRTAVLSATVEEFLSRGGAG